MNLNEQIYPSKEEFLRLAGDFDRVTIYREIVGDTFTPITLLRNFSNEENIFLLESANLDKTFSRFFLSLATILRGSLLSRMAR